MDLFHRYKPSKTFLPLLLGASSFLLICFLYLSFHQTSTLIYTSSPFVFNKTLLSSSSSSSSLSSSTSLSKSFSSLSHEQTPHQHVYYLKTHKTGSTTMFFIMAEYCRAHDLLPLLPRFRSMHINQRPPLYSGQLYLIGNVRKYDMVFNHHIFDPSIFNYLHSDTFSFTTLREPFDNFVSAFLYYREVWHSHYLLNISGPDPITKFLLNPKKYELESYRSFTNNRQSVDLGYDVARGFDDIDYIKSFIDKTEKRFNLVLITEYFDESLVILKRALRWNTQDILYLSKNKGKFYKDQKDDPNKEKLQRDLHAQISKPDIMLYDHFLTRFKERMKKEPGLQEEVKEFRDILDRFRDFCKYFNDQMSKSFVIPAGKWTNGFYVSPHKCKWLELKEGHITRYLQVRQMAMFQKG